MSHGWLNLVSPEILKTVYRVSSWKAIPKLDVKSFAWMAEFRGSENDDEFISKVKCQKFHLFQNCLNNLT